MEPRALKNWAVVYFTDFGSEDTVKRFVAELINGHLEKLGWFMSTSDFRTCVDESAGIG